MSVVNNIDNIFLEAFGSLDYKERMLELFSLYINQDMIDDNKIIDIGYELYGKNTHITYEYSKLRDAERDFISKLLEHDLLTKEFYNKISYFIEAFSIIITFGYSKHCMEVSDNLEQILYNEDILPEIFRPSAVFKNNITKDFLAYNGKPSIAMDPKACDVYKEIVLSNVPEYIKEDINKVHNRLHEVGEFYYKLLSKSDLINAYAAFWRMRYLNLLIVFALTNYTLQSEKEFYETFFQKHKAPMLIIARNGKIIKVNESALKFYGYPEDYFTSLYIWQIEKFYKEIGIDGKPYFRFKHIIANDEEKDVEVFSAPVKIEGKEYTATIVMDVTITRIYQKLFMLMKNIEDAFIKYNTKEDFLKAVVDIFKSDENIKSVVLQLKDKVKISQNACYGDNCCVEDIEHSPYIIIPVINDNDNNIIGNIYVCTSKKYFEYYKDFAKEIEYIIKQFLDRLNLREKLEEQKAFFEKLAENIKAGIIIYDLDNIYYANKYAIDILSYDKESIKRLSIFDIVSPKYSQQIIQSFIEEKDLDLDEVYLIKKDGSFAKAKYNANILNLTSNKKLEIGTFVEIEISDFNSVKPEILYNILNDVIKEPAVVFKLLRENIEILFANNEFYNLLDKKPKNIYDIFPNLDLKETVLSLEVSGHFVIKSEDYSAYLTLVENEPLIIMAIFKKDLS